MVDSGSSNLFFRDSKSIDRSAEIGTKNQCLMVPEASSIISTMFLSASAEKMATVSIGFSDNVFIRASTAAGLCATSRTTVLSPIVIFSNRAATLAFLTPFSNHSRWILETDLQDFQWP